MGHPINIETIKGMHMNPRPRTIEMEKWTSTKPQNTKDKDENPKAHHADKTSQIYKITRTLN
jgi:hypothetical protein